MRVKSFGGVATFVVYRQDGHELSLSSVSNSLVEFDGNKAVIDHGYVYDPAVFAAILNGFIAEESEESEPVNVYARHPHRSA